MPGHVAIIGAGIGGLVSAALLARQGLCVTVLEKEKTPGGKIRSVPVGTSAVDGGPTVFTLKSVFDQIFADCGASLDERVRATPAHILARHRWSETEQLDLFADPRESEDAIGIFAGPNAVRGFRAFSAEAKRIYDVLERPFLQNSRVYPPGLMWRIGMWRLADLIAIRPYESLWKVLGEHFRDRRLRQLFARYATYCGSSPFLAPATLMLIAHVEARGVWQVQGGMTALADALAELAAEQGARFRYREKVVGMERKGGMHRVVLASGDEVEADAVLVNADPAALADGRFGVDGRRAVKPYPVQHRSLSAMTWLMQARTRSADLARHNVFFSADYQQEFNDLADGRVPERPSVYVCALDRGESLPGPSGPERLQIIVNAPPIGDSHIFSPEEIDRCTRQMLERLKACGLDIDLASPPVVQTPTDFEQLFPSTGGALYGRASHGWAASFLRQSARTRIPGLYCVGGSTHPGAGVPMAALSGRLAAATVMKDLGSTVRFRPAAMPGGTSTRSAMPKAEGGGSALPSSASSAASSHLTT